MAFPNPLTLEIELAGSPIPLLVRPLQLEIEVAGTPVVNYFTLGPASLEIEFGGASVLVGQSGFPSIEALDIEAAGTPIPGNRPPPFRLEFEYQGGTVPLSALGAPAIRSLEIEKQGFPVPGSKPTPYRIEVEVFQPDIAAGLISALYDVESAVLTTLSKATYVDVSISSNVFPKNLKALAIVSGSGYFSDPANWAAVFTVYVKDGTTDVTFFARHKVANEVWPGEFTLRSINPTGTYNKVVLIEGLNGDTLVVPNTDINEPLTIIA